MRQFFAVLLVVLMGSTLHASDAVPPELQGVGVVEHRGDVLPLDARFFREDGATASLGEYFRTGRPVIINLVYYSCPTLCTLVLNGFLQSLKQLSWTAGNEFDIVTISIDTRDIPVIAKAKKANYLASYGRKEAENGWHFLTGEADQIARVAKSLGFLYRWDDRQQQFAHAAVIFVATPDGKISRYLYGMEFPATDVRLALMEAADGKIGGVVDQFLLFCYHYDPVGKRYGFYAMNLVRVSGVLTMAILLGVLGRFWVREYRTARDQATS